MSKKRALKRQLAAAKRLIAKLLVELREERERNGKGGSDA